MRFRIQVLRARSSSNRYRPIAIRARMGPALALVLFLVAGSATGEVVPGTSNPWLAGMPPGSSDNGNDGVPAESPVLVGSIDVSGSISVTVSATGGASFQTGCTIPPNASCSPPDGGGAVGPHAGVGGVSNGIAGLNAPFSALIGVFLDDSQPDTTGAPASLDFSGGGLGIDFSSLSPALKQPFFIGDGLTSGAQPQEFVVPAGATRLFLGIHDGFGWFNNTGQFDAVLTAVPSVSVPSVSDTGILILTSLLMLAGLGAIATSRRHAR